MIHSDDFETFKAFYEDEKNEQYWQLEQALEVAIVNKKQVFIDFLIGFQMKNVRGAIHKAIENGDFSLMKRLLVFEKDINQQRGQEAYLNRLISKLYENFMYEDQRANYEMAIEYFIEQGANPYLQERWTRDAFFCFKYFENESIKQAIQNFVEGLCKKYGRVPETDEPANQDTMHLLRKLMQTTS